MKKTIALLFASLLMVFANANADDKEKKYQAGTGGKSQEMMSEQGKAHEQGSENRMKRGNGEEEGKEKKGKKKKKQKKEKKSKKGE